MTERRGFGLGAAVLVALIAITAAHAQTLQRGVYASVLDKGGTPVLDMTPADFVVREDNLAREVLRVEPAKTAMQIALLVDNSAASSRSIRDIRDATTEFIKGVTGHGMENEVALITVGERPTILVDYTTDQAKLLKGAAIFTLPNSGAYMLDGIFETARALKKREARRPVIIGIATNGPEYSNRYRDQVVGVLTDAGASLSIVMVGPPPTDVATNEGRERAWVFSDGTDTTGGRYDNVLAASAMGMRLKQVADELTHQYVVTYARPQSLIPPEHIKITSKRPDVTVRGTPVKVSK
jgi:von Willebrand factor type A domain